METPTNDNEIKIMKHAQFLPNGDLRCIYERRKALGSDRCMTTFIQGTPELQQAFEAARASGALVDATEAVF